MWKLTIEEKRLKINKSKTEYIEYEFDERKLKVDEMRSVMTVSGEELGKGESFKYLGSFVQKNEGFDKDVKYRIRCEWIKGREMSGILYDKRIPMRLKGKFYKSVVRSTILYYSVLGGEQENRAKNECSRDEDV